MLCTTFYCLHQQLETFRMGKYKNADEIPGGASPSVSNISIGQLFLVTREVDGENEKAKPYPKA